MRRNSERANSRTVTRSTPLSFVRAVHELKEAEKEKKEGEKGKKLLRLSIEDMRRKRGKEG